MIVKDRESTQALVDVPSDNLSVMSDSLMVDVEQANLLLQLKETKEAVESLKREWNAKQARMQIKIDMLEEALESMHSKRSSKNFVFYAFFYLEKTLKRIYRIIPLPFRVKNYLKSAYFKYFYKFRIKRRSLTKLKYHVGMILENPQKKNNEDVFFWGVIDWHFRIQRPQHIAKSFAEMGRRVFYFSNEFIDSDSPGFKVEKLDEHLELYRIRLHVTGALQIYYGKAPFQALRQLKESMNCFYQWSETRSAYSIVQHPFWLDLVELLPNQALIYDCMDHHGGFENNVTDILQLEEKLVNQADMLVVTSQWLYQELSSKNSKISLIRNAGDFQHFSVRPIEIFQDEQNRKIIGYYGAIAEWFDVELVEEIAKEFSDCLILLVGSDTARAGNILGKYPNILMIGEVGYQELPYFLHAIDVCLIPFKVIPLTLATNPVKAYEYLSAGKPVVSVDLPELHEFENNVVLAKTHDQFIASIKNCLLNQDSEENKLQRIAFAKSQTWFHRVFAMQEAIKIQAHPLISIVIVTYNNLACTKACLASLEEFTEYPNYEVIIIDNNSTDGTQVFLQDFVASKLNYSLVLNQDNLGFSAANNQGLRVARGDYMVLLNNDTYVTTGWLASLYRYFKRFPLLGMVGPITNNIGNEAKINIHYSDMTEMAEKAKAITLAKMGVSFAMPVIAFFCVMVSRKVYEEIGELDEDFGIGMFEDDDYCQRVRKSGYQILCADDVFIHHHLSASFDQMGAKRKQQLFEKNKLIYEKKWGKWTPHQFRDENG